jgi:hypothetical protein
MKLIVLGDIHGRPEWQTIAAENEFDKFVFVGDYFDTHEDVSPQQQLDNFKKIIEFRENNRGKVILLTGNHDYHYLPGVKEHYSGFQYFHENDIRRMLADALSGNLLQMCFSFDHFLITHAGVTKTWYKNTFHTEDVSELHKITSDINNIFMYKPDAFKFTSGANRSITGDDITQSPIWVRPESLLQDMITGYTQIVGHTEMSKLRLSPRVIFIDTLRTSGEFLTIDNGKTYVKR